MKNKINTFCQKIVWTSVLTVLFLCPMVCFADDLELSLAVEQNGSLVKPFNKSITVQQQPIPFAVILTNHSGSSVPVYWEAGTGGMSSLSFELTNELGGIIVVKQKPVPLQSSTQLKRYLAAGESVDKVILIDIDQWENVPVIEPGKVQKFKVRAVYENDGKKIYSDPYTLVLDGQ